MAKETAAELHQRMYGVLQANHCKPSDRSNSVYVLLAAGFTAAQIIEFKGLNNGTTSETARDTDHTKSA